MVQPQGNSEVDRVELQRIEFDTKRVELELKLRELQEKTGLSKHVNPLVLAIGAALIGFLTNVWVTNQQTKSASELKRFELESSLILKAVATNDPAAAVKNLRFFLEAGLINDPGGKIVAYISKHGEAATLPAIAVGATRAFEGYSYTYTGERSGATCSAFFLRTSADFWIESTRENQPGCNDATFYFREVSRDASWRILFDYSRSMYVRLPAAGGRSQWSKERDGPWIDMHVVTRLGEQTNADSNTIEPAQ